MIGRAKGSTWKPMRQLTDEHIAIIMTYKGYPMGKTAVTDSATRAERKLFGNPIIQELAKNLWGTI